MATDRPRRPVADDASAPFVLRRAPSPEPVKTEPLRAVSVGLPQHLLQLQRNAGNAAVLALVAGRAKRGSRDQLGPQREGPVPAPSPAPSPSPASSAEETTTLPLGEQAPEVTASPPSQARSRPPAPERTSSDDEPLPPLPARQPAPVEVPDVPPAEGPTAAQGRVALDEAVAEAKSIIDAGADRPTPTPLSPAAQPVLEALAEAASGTRSAVAGSAVEATHAVSAAATEQAQQVRAGAAEQERAVRGSESAARQGVGAAAGASRAQLRGSEQAQRARLSAWRQQSSAVARQNVTAAAQQTRTAASEQATRSNTAGQTAATKVGATMTNAAALAEQGSGSAGAGEAAEARAEVDQKVSEDTASQMQSAAPDSQKEIARQSREAAAEVQRGGEQVASVIAREAGPLTDRVGQTASTASVAVSRGSAQAAGQVSQAARDAAQSLHTTQAAGTRLLRAQSDQAQGALASAAASAIRHTTTQASRSMQEIREAEAEATQRLATADLDEATAAELTGEVPAHWHEAHKPISTDLRATGADAGAALTGAGQQTRTELDQFGAAAGGTLREGAAAFAEQAPAAARSGSQALAAAAQAATGAGDALVEATSAHLTAQAGQAGAALAVGSTALEAHLAEHSTDADTRAQDALTGARDRVRDGQSRVDTHMSAGPAVQRGVLGDIGDWLADQLKDLWNMLKSPSFWVGLIVTIVLFPALGPGALVVGGVVGGAVSGIEDNVRHNRPWYEPGPIIRGAAIGAVAGAAIAFGAGVILGLGLEGAVALGAVMGLSAAVGIGANVAVGERWDRGLLANLFLAWIFHRIANRARTPVEEPTPPKGTPESASGGRVETRVPGLYEGVKPDQPPRGGWKFVDDIQEFGNIREIETRVTSPEGDTGRMIRSVETDTGMLTMEQAFLDQIPSGSRWVQTEPPVVPGRGTPLETYMTMRQMRLMESMGSTFTGPRTVHMSTIVNTRTCLALAAAEARGIPRNVAILETHSVQYAKNSIVQSGGRIDGATVTGGGPRVASSLRGATPEVLAEYGVRPDQQVPFGFDIDLAVVPAEAPAHGGAPGAGSRSQTPVLVPVPPGRED